MFAEVRREKGKNAAPFLLKRVFGFLVLAECPNPLAARTCVFLLFQSRNFQRGSVDLPVRVALSFSGFGNFHC